MGILYSSWCWCNAILLFAVGGEGLGKLTFMTFQNEAPLDVNNKRLCAAGDKMKGRLGAFIRILTETAPCVYLCCIYNLIYVTATVCKKQSMHIHSTQDQGL